jgi:SAM-dependent methyltransferase
MENSRFDAAYYRRYYRDRGTRVGTPADTMRLCRFAAAYLAFLGLRVRSVLDVGCGVGWSRAACRALFPRASWRGVEVSDYLCRRHGFAHGSVVDYAPGRTFDLVLCQGVLQYLADRDAARAITNLGRLSRGALYLEALTRRDARENCDPVTDLSVHLRSGGWYLARLHRSFVNCGGGLFLAKTAPVTTFELETLR